jgi:UrcA family protein
MSRSLFLASATFIATLAALPQPAQAQAAANPVRTAMVSYADLDLNTPGGIATLDRRIRGAIHGVCGPADPRDLQGQDVDRQCRNLATANARTQRTIVLARASSAYGAIQLSSR